MFSYPLRHWRGDLTLAVAWWVNGVALTVLALAFDASGGLGVVLPEPASRSGFGLFLAAGTLWLLAVPAWQVIGIFRAADRHAATEGTILAARLVQSATTLLTVALAVRFLIFAGENVPVARIAFTPGERAGITVIHAGRALEVRGSIGFGVTAAVERALAAHPNVRRLRLESGGGLLGEARRLRALIRERDLDTDSREVCSSACVSAYVGGRHRLLGRAARMGVHLPRNPGFGPRGPVSPAYSAELAYLGGIGVPRWFREKWVATGRRFWYPAPDQLRRAGIVQTFYGRPRPGEEFYF